MVGLGGKRSGGSGSGSGLRSTMLPTSASPLTEASGNGGAEPRMYFLEGGLLVASSLLKTDAWVQDDERTHCNVCVQQFLPFRRRHHCRTVRHPLFFFPSAFIVRIISDLTQTV